MTKETSKISSKNFNLLLSIVKNNHCFDRKDNTFKLSNRATAKRLGITIYSVNTLMNNLKERGLTKIVTTSLSNQLMLNPSFLFRKPRKNYYWYSRGLWYYESHKETIEWINFCWEHGKLIEPSTGEILNKNLHYVFYPHRNFKSGYKEFILNIEINHPEMACIPE